MGRHLAGLVQAVSLDAAPSREGEHFEIAVSPAPALAGMDRADLCQILMLPHHRIAALIGDIQGSGVTARLLAQAVRQRAKELLISCPRPEEILASINRQLCPSSLTATAVLAVVDVESRMSQMSAAGHAAPIRLSDQQGSEVLRVERGPALGLSPVTRYKRHEVMLDRRDAVVFCSRTPVNPSSERRLVLAGSELHVRSPHAVATGIRAACREIMGPVGEDVHVAVLRVA